MQRNPGLTLGYKMAEYPEESELVLSLKRKWKDALAAGDIEKGREAWHGVYRELYIIYQRASDTVTKLRKGIVDPPGNKAEVEEICKGLAAGLEVFVQKQAQVLAHFPDFETAWARKSLQNN